MIISYYIIIYHMSTLSVPLTPALEEAIEHQVRMGESSNKAAFARKAIEKYLEDMAVMKVLQAEQEAREGKVFTGDLGELLKKFK